MVWLTFAHLFSVVLSAWLFSSFCSIVDIVFSQGYCSMVGVSFFLFLLSISAHVSLTFALRICCARRLYVGSQRHAGSFFSRLNSYNGHSYCILLHSRGGFFLCKRQSHGLLAVKFGFGLRPSMGAGAARLRSSPFFLRGSARSINRLLFFFAAHHCRF